jgi:hypothetical protein
MECRSVKGLQGVVSDELFVVRAGEEDCFSDILSTVAALPSSADIYRSKIIASSDLSRQEEIFLAVFAGAGPQRSCDLGFGIHRHLGRFVKAESVDVKLADEKAREMLDLLSD